jgi:hypothetical protein
VAGDNQHTSQSVARLISCQQPSPPWAFLSRKNNLQKQEPYNQLPAHPMAGQFLSQQTNLFEFLRSDSAFTGLVLYSDVQERVKGVRQVCVDRTLHIYVQYSVQYLIPAVQADLTLTAGVGGDEARSLVYYYSTVA